MSKIVVVIPVAIAPTITTIATRLRQTIKTAAAPTIARVAAEALRARSRERVSSAGITPRTEIKRMSKSAVRLGLRTRSSHGGSRCGSPRSRCDERGICSRFPTADDLLIKRLANQFNISINVVGEGSLPTLIKSEIGEHF